MNRRSRLAGLLVVLYVGALASAYLLSRRQPDSSSNGGSMPLLSSSSKGDRVGIVRIHGPIFESESRGFIPTGVRAWAKRLETLSKKDEVKAIVLDINSPGGSVGAVQELYSLLQRVRTEEKKPVVAFLRDVAASGGYYLAAGCDKIVSHPGTLTGSIGVILQGGNVEGLLDKIGVKVRPIKSGPHKDIGSMTRAMTPEERRILQALIDDAYDQFLGAVRDGRKEIAAERLPELADGRIFTGRQALEEGLVDQLGDSRDALALAGKLGGIEGEPKVYKSDEALEDLIRMLDMDAGPLDRLFRAASSFGPGLAYFWTGF